MSDENRFGGVKTRSSVDYMLRTTQQHHVELSKMADQKASILVGASLALIGINFGLNDKAAIFGRIADSEFLCIDSGSVRDDSGIAIDAQEKNHSCRIT